MSTAREEMLDRIRSALSDVPVNEPPQARPGWHEPAGVASVGASAELFRDRVEDYAATVTSVADEPAAVRAAIAEVLTRHRAGDVLAAPGFPAEWLPDG